MVGCAAACCPAQMTPCMSASGVREKAVFAAGMAPALPSQLCTRCTCCPPHHPLHSACPPHTGSLVLGQRQLCFGGCFTPEYSLHGELAQLRVWSRVLGRWGHSLPAVLKPSLLPSLPGLLVVQSFFAKRLHTSAHLPFHTGPPSTHALHAGPHQLHTHLPMDRHAPRPACCRDELAGNMFAAQPASTEGLALSYNFDPANLDKSGPGQVRASRRGLACWLEADLQQSS